MNEMRDESPVVPQRAPERYSGAPDDIWTMELFEAKTRALGTTPEDRLLGIFLVLDELFHLGNADARAFVETLSGLSTSDPDDLDKASMLLSIVDLIDTLTLEADLFDLQELAFSWRILMRGAILKSLDGDLEAGTRALSMARDLIAHHRKGKVANIPIAATGAEASAFDSDAFDLDALAELNAAPKDSPRPAAKGVMRVEVDAKPCAGLQDAVCPETSRYRTELDNLQWVLG